MPSGVSASPQGLRGPDSRGLPRTPQKPDGGTASMAPGASPNSRASPGKPAQERLGSGQTAGPRVRDGVTFFGVETGAFTGTHPEHTCEAPALVQRGPSGPLPTQAHARLRCTQAHPAFHTLAHVHTQGGDRRLWGLRQRGISLWLPDSVGRRLDPSWGEAL